MTTDAHISEATKVVLTLTRTVVFSGALLGAGWFARDRVSEFDKGVDMKLAVMAEAIRDVATKSYIDEKLNAASELCYQRTTKDLSELTLLCDRYPVRGQPQECKAKAPRR